MPVAGMAIDIPSDIPHPIHPCGWLSCMGVEMGQLLGGLPRLALPNSSLSDVEMEGMLQIENPTTGRWPIRIRNDSHEKAKQELHLWER